MATTLHVTEKVASSDTVVYEAVVLLGIGLAPLYHWYVKEVGLLDQVPLFVVSFIPTPTEAGPEMEGAVDFSGAKGITSIGLLGAGALSP